MSRQFIKDGMLLLVAKLFSIVSSTIVAIFVARYYGVQIYGAYTTAIAFSTFILTFTDLGLDTFMLKECSRDNCKLNTYFSNIIVLKLLLVFITSIVIIVSSIFLGYSKDIVKLIIILLPSLMINYIIGTFFVVMQIKNKLSVNARIQLFQNFLIIIIAISVLVLKLNVYIYSLLQTLLSLVIFGVYIFIRQAKFTPTLRYTKILVRGSYLFGLSSLLYIIYYKVDVIMLSLMKGSIEVGIYESAYKIVNIIISLIVVLDNLVMPRFFRLFKEDKNRMMKIYEMFLKYALIFGIPVSLTIMFLSKHIINILYGKEFFDAILILQILVWSISIRLLAAIVGFVITASDNMKKKIKFQFYFAICNVAINLFLIPKYGVVGASISTIVTELLVFIAYFSFVSKTFGSMIYFEDIVKCLLVNTILILILYYAKDFNFILNLIIAGVAYFGVIMIVFKKDFFQMMNLFFSIRRKKVKCSKWVSTSPATVSDTQEKL